MYDLIIIGAGPAGYNAAERAAHKGLKTLIFDKHKLGGVCLNTGCIPTKTMLYSAKLFEQAKESAKYGISIENPGFDYKKIIQRKNKVVRKLVGGVAAKLKNAGVEVIAQKASVWKRKKDSIVLKSGDKLFQARNLLIATGSVPFIPPIKGLERDKILTHVEILDLETPPKSLAIIGGGVIGLEFGSFFNSMGTQVTIIEMMPEILPETDAEFSAMLRKEYSKKGIDFHLNAKVTELRDSEIFFHKDGNTQRLAAEKILVCTGRKPVTEGLGLENIGVEMHKDGIKIDQHCRTNIPNVYAAGDVTGFSLLAHTAYREGEVAVNHITGRNDQMRYNAIPAVVYTNPELASVGLTEEQARKQNIEYQVRSLPMQYAGRFVAENEGKNGTAKILVGKKYGEILGVHLLANPASEMIYAAGTFIEAQFRTRDVEEIVFPHPTVSEIIREAIFTFSH